MAGLNLVPNEILGYRIRPDWHSFNVVLVKRHGPGSKKAGQEYETVLGYCAGLSGAVGYIVSHSTRTRGMVSQDDQQALDGSVASVRALEVVFQRAMEDAQAAVRDLEARIQASGVLQKTLVKALGEPVGAEEDRAS